MESHQYDVYRRLLEKDVTPKGKVAYRPFNPSLDWSHVIRDVETIFEIHSTNS